MDFPGQEIEMADSLVLAAFGYAGWLYYKNLKSKHAATTDPTQGDLNAFQNLDKVTMANLGVPLRNHLNPPTEVVYNIQDLVQRKDPGRVDRAIVEGIGESQRDSWRIKAADSVDPGRGLWTSFHNVRHPGATSDQVQWALASDEAAMIPALANAWARDISGDRLIPNNLS